MHTSTFPIATDSYCPRYATVAYFDIHISVKKKNVHLKCDTPVENQYNIKTFKNVVWNLRRHTLSSVQLLHNV